MRYVRSKKRGKGRVTTKAEQGIRSTHQQVTPELAGRKVALEFRNPSVGKI